MLKEQLEAGYELPIGGMKGGEVEVQGRGGSLGQKNTSSENLGLVLGSKAGVRVREGELGEIKQVRDSMGNPGEK